MEKLARFTRNPVLSALAVALALSCAPQLAGSQESAPKGNKAFKSVPKEAVDLGPEIPGMEGRQLRMRLLTIEPGGHIGIHSHKDRPAVIYVLQGTTTVILDDGTMKRVGPGQTSSANRDTMHWHRNDEKEPVVFIAVDIFRKSK